MAMKAWGRPIYHRIATSLKVSDSGFHFKESSSLMMAICVLMEATCDNSETCHISDSIHMKFCVISYLFLGFYVGTLCLF